MSARRFTALLLVATPLHAQTPAPPALISSLDRLAAAGNAEALYHLGMAYQTGAGVTVDHARALAYFRRAADKGDPLAAFKVGCFYDGQDGVLTPDPAQALAYDLIAAKAGYALAQQDVAGLYLRRGEPGLAAEWMARAAAQGWPNALLEMATLHNGKNGLTHDPVLVAAYFDLLLRATGASDAQRAYLDQLRAALTPAQRQRVNAMIARFRPTPTALTLKGLSGQRAAAALTNEN